MSQHLWFKAKTYGWGWTPATWQGWAVIAVYVAVLVAILRRLEGRVFSARETLLEVTLPIIVITVALIAVSAWKGESPRWRWGKD